MVNKLVPFNNLSHFSLSITLKKWVIDTTAYNRAIWGLPLKSDCLIGSPTCANMWYLHHAQTTLFFSTLWQRVRGFCCINMVWLDTDRQTTAILGLVWAKLTTLHDSTCSLCTLSTRSCRFSEVLWSCLITLLTIEVIKKCWLLPIWDNQVAHFFMFVYCFVYPSFCLITFCIFSSCIHRSSPQRFVLIELPDQHRPISWSVIWYLNWEILLPIIVIADHPQNSCL